MAIDVKIVTDSVGPNGVRLTTAVFRYPRFIHSELMTHRDFSRNASSSRAIPTEKQIQMVIDEPAMPIAFRKNQKGMQAGELLDEAGQREAERLWLLSRDEAVRHAREMSKLGVHKQYVNRILEPFSHISVVVTASRWSNFFALRHHSAAQPEIAELARQMWELYQENTPTDLKEGSWHLPFVSKDDILEHADNLGMSYDDFDRSKEQDEVWMHENFWLPLIKRSVARCARVSYLNHDGTQTTMEQDFALFERLLGSQPIHASPAEHQARASTDEKLKSGNLHGWLQYRKMLENEYITEFNGPLG